MTVIMFVCSNIWETFRVFHRNHAVRLPQNLTYILLNITLKEAFAERKWYLFLGLFSALPCSRCSRAPVTLKNFIARLRYLFIDMYSFEAYLFMSGQVMKRCFLRCTVWLNHQLGNCLDGLCIGLRWPLSSFSLALLWPTDVSLWQFA